MQFIPYLPVHLDMMDLQDGQLYMAEIIKGEEYREYLTHANGISAVENGRCYGCAGWAEIEEGRAVVWSLLGKDIGNKFLSIHRKTLKTIDKLNFRRLEMITRDNDTHKRWAKMLGFKCETPNGMKNYWFDGAKGFLYSRVGG